MAQNSGRSRAERAVSASRKNKNKITNRTIKSTKSNGKQMEQKKIPEKNPGNIPPRLISSAVFLGLFILLLVMYLKPDGQIPKLMKSIVCGTIGKVGFIVAIPVSIYLFSVHAFSGKRPVKLRTICAGAFVLICGCLSHLSKNVAIDANLFQAIQVLYEGGVTGATGGFLCGGIVYLLSALLGNIISYIALILLAILTLLGSMQITVPSIVRAIQERPRADWEEEDAAEEKPEPASIVVNHLAKKRISRIEAKREREAAREDLDRDLDIAADNTNAFAARSEVHEEANKRASDMMKQIDSDVAVPVAAAADPVVGGADKDIHIQSNSAKIEDAFPENMPELMLDAIPQQKAPETAIKKVTAKEAEASAQEVAIEIEQSKEAQKQVYYFPPIDLLKAPGFSSSDGTSEMRENSRRLNETLASFKIDAHIVNVTRGPSVTRYEVELEKGVKLSKLTTAADDIALSLGATGVRIAAVPGKISVVGIEVPNKAVTSVTLREVIDSQDFSKAKSCSSFAVGKDIGGNCIVGNIARLPHMLIAGTTGSGKSVCMNSIIISLLYKASPDDVKLIMIDPKMVELGIYNGIPHLLIPVVTDPKKAAGSLQWAVSEMMRRYKAMSDAGVRDLESYNSMIESEQAEGTKLPQVVVIIDELADLMLVAAKEVEESICRIAQMGRAAGIHLIIATQRPSADVITGLMKANIPSRIAFAVASAMESRIILDTQGAEKLVGRGDMLYAPIGNGKPRRVQGCFVSEQEVEAVATHVKSAYASDYNQQIMEDIERKAAQTGNKTVTASDPEPNSAETDHDEMLPAAVDVILETKQASVSMLQRRLKLGYARAARIVDEMAEMGIVGPFQGSKPRDILITKEQWEAMRSGTPSQMNFDDFDDHVPTDEDF